MDGKFRNLWMAFIIGTIVATTVLLHSENLGQKDLSFMEIEKIVLQELDLPKYSLKYQRKSFFLPQIFKIDQSFRFHTGEEIHVKYGKFNSLEETLKGVEHYMENVAPVFQEGSFTGLKIGDKSWVSKSHRECTILFIKNNFLVLLGVPGSDRDEDKKKIESIAQLIIKKIEKNGKGSKI